MNIASRGVQGCGFSTTVHPPARAGADFTVYNINGKLNGVIAPTTPTGSRNRALPLTPVWPAVGASASTHLKVCSAMSAFDFHMPIEPPACTKSRMNPAAPV
jgi:hypothetical protein